MSNSVTPPLAQAHGARPKADRHGQNKDIDRSAFGEVLQAGPRSRGAPEKGPLQSGQRWLPPIKLAVAMGTIERTVDQPPLELLASVEVDEIDELGEAEKGDDEPEASATLVFPPAPAAILHHPAVALRRGAVKNDADPHSSKPKLDIDPPVTTGSTRRAAEAANAVKQTVRIDPAPLAAPNQSAAAPAVALERAVSTVAGDRPPLKPERAQPDLEAKPTAPRAAFMVEQAGPALAPAGSTALNLAEKLATQAALIQAPAKPDAPAPTASPQPVQAHTLKLQLHPAELGIVTASLRFAGEQLTIELQVESAHAHQRLSADSETIVKTLRGLGYEIDRVTILQPAIAPAAPSRVDADPSLAGQSRSDPQSLGAGGSDNGGDRLGRRDSGGGGEETQRDGQKNPGGRPETRTDDGLYI